jgi:hypothetical protein
MANIIAPIANYACPDPSVRFGNDLCIEEMPKHISVAVQRAAEQKMIRHPVDYHYSLVYKSFEPDHDDSREIMERLITAMRLFKQGNIFYNYAIVDQNNFYSSPPAGKPVEIGHFAVFFFMGWHCEGLPDTFELLPSEIEKFQAFVATNWKRPKLYTRPFRFFFKAYHEGYAEHRFLDYVIALENVLANDSKDMSNIRYKFIDRGCYLLSKYCAHLGTPDSLGKALAEIYDRRCEIVHSTSKDRDWNEENSLLLLRQTDIFTRALLRLILEKEDLGDSRAIDAEKRAGYSI